MTQTRRGLRLIALVTATLTMIALRPGVAAAASCSGQSHDLALTSGVASPASGTTATTFQFSVTYADNAGCEPTLVEVVVGGVGTFALTLTSGDLTSGATFTRAMTLPAGSHGYSFRAVSGSGAGERTITLAVVTPGAVTVVSPTPKPTPPPPPPTPRITAPPPPPTPTITAPPPPPPPTPGATLAAPASATAAAAGSPTAGASSETAGGGIDSAASGPPDAPSGADQAAPLPAANPGGDSRPLQELAVAGLGTVVGLGLFILLGTRLLGTRVAPRPLPLIATRASSSATDEAIEVWAVPDRVAGTIAPAIDDDVAGTFGATREPMRFVEPPQQGIDRCRVVSRLVALRREPDEVSWPHPDRLDVGDEVDVLRQDGPYCYVRTPVRVEGWVPGLTLSGVRAPDPEPGADDGR